MLNATLLLFFIYLPPNSTSYLNYFTYVNLQVMENLQFLIVFLKKKIGSYNKKVQIM